MEAKEFIDKNVERLCESFYNRQYHGFKKYGVTTERTDIDLEGWVQHALEEAQDLCVYLMRAKQQLENDRNARTSTEPTT